LLWLLLLGGGGRLGWLLLLGRRGSEQSIDLSLEGLEFDLNLVDRVSDVLVELLGGEDLLDHIEEGAHLGDLGQDLLAILLGDAGAPLIRQLVINFLSEIVELLFVDGEVRAEVESGLDRVCKLLELLESLLVGGVGSRLALTIDPINGLLETLDEGNASIFFDVLLHGSVVVDVILNLIGVRLELILDSLELKDILVLGEPLLLQVVELLSCLRSKSM